MSGTYGSGVLHSIFLSWGSRQTCRKYLSRRIQHSLRNDVIKNKMPWERRVLINLSSAQILSTLQQRHLLEFLIPAVREGGSIFNVCWILILRGQYSWALYWTFIAKIIKWTHQWLRTVLKIFLITFWFVFIIML